MSRDEKPKEAFSLRRWARVKSERARAVTPAPEPPPPAQQPPASAAPAAAAAPAPEATPLPAVDSLTIDSDFTAFLAPKVDEVLKRKALRKLFADPRFNVMDGLDVYIDDYSKPDPLDPRLAERLAQARAILEPDVPPDRAAAADVGRGVAAPVEGESASGAQSVPAGERIASNDADSATGEDAPQPR
jgi:hypothetical protein